MLAIRDRDTASFIRNVTSGQGDRVSASTAISRHKIFNTTLSYSKTNMSESTSYTP